MAACAMEQLQQAMFFTEAPDRRSPSMKAAEGGVRSPGVVPSKLFIGGLTRHTTTKQLRDHFSHYGRVLDCVAMRQPDGRPRGFGYVTLDSPLAAEACLQTPQVVDGRVVDVKRAVPGFAMDSPSHGGPSPMAVGGARGRKGSSPMLPPGTWETLGPYLSSGFAPADHSPAAAAAAWWATAGTPAGGDMLDCLELLQCGRVPPSPASMLGVFPETPGARFGAGSRGAVCESLGLLTAGYGAGLTSEGSLGRSRLGLGRRMASEDGVGSPSSTPLRGASNGVLSASAAEFVPRGVAAGDQNRMEEGLDDDTPQKVESSLKPARGGRAVLGEITNVMSSGLGGKIGAGGKSWSPVKAPLPSAAGGNGMGLLQVFDDTPTKPNMKAVKPAPVKPGLVQGLENRPPPLLVYEDGEDENDGSQTPFEQKASEDSASDTSEVAGEGSVQMQISEGMLSVGSAEHAAGSCKRCSFFARGRCQNGEDCKFCHLSHDVARKPTRQERRERRGAKSEDSQEMVVEASLSTCGLPPGLSPPQRRPSQATPSAAGILSTVPVQPEASVASVAAGVAAAPRTWTPQAPQGPALLSTTPKAAAQPQAALEKQARKHSTEPTAEAPAREGCVWSREELLSHRIVVAKEIAAASGKEAQ